MIRLLLCLLVAVFFVLCAAAMWWGWTNRQRRQSHLPALPRTPELTGEPLLPPGTGVYVSTTTEGDWQDRIVVGQLGFRSAARWWLYPEGMLVERTGADPLWIPVGALCDARTGRAIAGKVMGVEGLLVVSWRLGDHRLDTGFRADDKDIYGAWIDAIRALAAKGTATAGAQGGDER
jgi:hypothetical protein